MAGPALRQVAAHHDIHAAAHDEVALAMAAFEEACADPERGEIWQSALLAAGVWRARVLSHADAEDEELFPEILQVHPDAAMRIAALMRDHEVMRRLVALAEEDIASGAAETALGRLKAAMAIQELHALEEEQILPRWTSDGYTGGGDL